MALKIPPLDSPELLDVAAVARLLDCSTRHVARLVEARSIPAPVRLGTLVRWQRSAITQWIAQGCKPIGDIAAQGDAQ